MSKSIKWEFKLLTKKIDDIGLMVAELIVEKRKHDSVEKPQGNPSKTPKEFFQELFQRNPNTKATIKEIFDEEEKNEKKDKEVIIKMVR